MEDRWLALCENTERRKCRAAAMLRRCTSTGCSMRAFSGTPGNSVKISLACFRGLFPPRTHCRALRQAGNVMRTRLAGIALRAAQPEFLPAQNFLADGAKQHLRQYISTRRCCAYALFAADTYTWFKTLQLLLFAYMTL